MPPRNPARDLFEHKWERVATAWGNLEALSQPDASRIEPTLRETAKAFTSERVTIKPMMIAATGFASLTPDLCARAATNNLKKLVIEEAELARLSSSEEGLIRSKLSELSAKCTEFSPKLPLGPARRDALGDAIVRFRRVF